MASATLSTISLLANPSSKAELKVEAKQIAKDFEEIAFYVDACMRNATLGFLDYEEVEGLEHDLQDLQRRIGILGRKIRSGQQSRSLLAHAMKQGRASCRVGSRAGDAKGTPPAPAMLA